MPLNSDVTRIVVGPFALAPHRHPSHLSIHSSQPCIHSYLRSFINYCVIPNFQFIIPPNFLSQVNERFCSLLICGHYRDLGQALFPLRVTHLCKNTPLPPLLTSVTPFWAPNPSVYQNPPSLYCLFHWVHSLWCFLWEFVLFSLI